MGLKHREIVVEKGEVRGHRAVRIKVRRRDCVLWTCRANDFRLVFKKGDNPFYQSSFEGKRGAWVCSGPARPGTARKEPYKSRIWVRGAKPIDPHVIVDP